MEGIRNLDSKVVEVLQNNGKFSDQLSKEEKQELEKEEKITEKLIKEEQGGFVL